MSYFMINLLFSRLMLEDSANDKLYQRLQTNYNNDQAFWFISFKASHIRYCAIFIQTKKYELQCVRFSASSFLNAFFNKPEYKQNCNECCNMFCTLSVKTCFLESKCILREQIYINKISTQIFFISTIFVCNHTVLYLTYTLWRR